MTASEPSRQGPSALHDGVELQTYATTTGPDGVAYVVQALPSGVIGWQYSASALHFGLIMALAAGLWNLAGRVLFRFGWQLKVTREHARWPHWSKVVVRRRFHRRSDALAGFSDLVEEIHTHGPAKV